MTKGPAWIKWKHLELLAASLSNHLPGLFMWAKPLVSLFISCHFSVHQFSPLLISLHDHTLPLYPMVWLSATNSNMRPRCYKSEEIVSLVCFSPSFSFYLTITGNIVIMNNIGFFKMPHAGDEAEWTTSSAADYLGMQTSKRYLLLKWHEAWGSCCLDRLLLDLWVEFQRR